MRRRVAVLAVAGMMVAGCSSSASSPEPSSSASSASSSTTTTRAVVIIAFNGGRDVEKRVREPGPGAEAVSVGRGVRLREPHLGRRWSGLRARHAVPARPRSTLQLFHRVDRGRHRAEQPHPVRRTGHRHATVGDRGRLRPVDVVQHPRRQPVPPSGALPVWSRSTMWKERRTVAARTATRQSTYPFSTCGVPTIGSTAPSRSDPSASSTRRHSRAFSFVTPTLCNDGHDCSNAVVDSWAKKHVQPVLESTAYRAGHVAVFIWYDEDRPVPNLWITPTAKAGAVTTPGAAMRALSKRGSRCSACRAWRTPAPHPTCGRGPTREPGCLPHAMMAISRRVGRLGGR